MNMGNSEEMNDLTGWKASKKRTSEHETRELIGVRLRFFFFFQVEETLQGFGTRWMLN